MRFSKMQATGNDFVITTPSEVESPGKLIARVPFLCDRRFGIGADGVILAEPSSNADARMRIFNSDGSEAEMCGNGIRCMVLYLEKHGIAARGMLSIETGAGIINTLRLDGSVRVDMGPPILDGKQIPVAGRDRRVVMEPVTVAGKVFRITAVSMGNPHSVVFVPALSDELVLHYGKEMERHPFFPKKVNAEFVKVISPREIEMRVYERGCGETLACGTGACAAVVAGIINNLLENRVTAHLPGGDLVVEWDGDAGHSVWLAGPAEWVFDGEIQI